LLYFVYRYVISRSNNCVKQKINKCKRSVRKPDDPPQEMEVIVIGPPTSDPTQSIDVTLMPLVLYLITYHN
jgi:hypothetical protein